MSAIGDLVDAVKADVVAAGDTGRVWTHDLYSHDDLAPLVIDNQGRLRAWWITGPEVTSKRVSPCVVERRCRLQIHGIVGVTETGDSVLTLRDLTEAVADVLDTDQTLGDTCVYATPCVWSIAPEHRILWAGIAAAYVRLDKTAVVATPIT